MLDTFYWRCGPAVAQGWADGLQIAGKVPSLQLGAGPEGRDGGFKAFWGIVTDLRPGRRRAEAG